MEPRITKILKVAGVKSLLFFSGYAPLGAIWITILWQDRKEEIVLTIIVVLAVVVISSLVFLYGFVKWAENEDGDIRPISHSQRRDDQLVSYIVTYAVPFLAIPSEGSVVAIGFGIFFLMVFALQIKLNLLYINPILAVFGYHLYEVSMEDKTLILLTKQENPPEREVHAINLASTILVATDH